MKDASNMNNSSCDPKPPPSVLYHPSSNATRPPPKSPMFPLNVLPAGTVPPNPPAYALPEPS